MQQFFKLSLGRLIICPLGKRLQLYRDIAYFQKSLSRSWLIVSILKKIFYTFAQIIYIGTKPMSLCFVMNLVVSLNPIGLYCLDFISFQFLR